MNQAAAIRVVVADDDLLVRAGLRMMIETQRDLVVVGEAGDGAEAVTMTAELAPDVVLMDIRMPGVDGLEATRRITAAARAARPTVDDESADAVDGPRVIVLTTFELDEYVYEAVRAGASGFLLKRTPPEDLLAGIRVVAAGDALLAPSVTRRLLDAFASSLAAEGHDAVPPAGAAAHPHGAALARLTDREREVLVLIAQGLSNREIADRLVIGESTAKTHVKRILMKLDVRDRVHAVVLAYESGLARPGG